jgi:hypothetical protein
MSSGVFGSIRPANVNPSIDVEILYYYRPTRSTTSSDFSGFKSLNPSEVLIQSKTESGSAIQGVFDLRLPLNEFNRKGFYSIYIRPKVLTAKIVDVNVLASYTDVKGLVLNLNDGDLASAGVTDLTGYRIEFSDGSSRLIKTCNRCEPTIVNTGDGYPKTTRYNLTDTSSDYVFCTVSPSSSPTFKPNASPYIGKHTEEISVINTKFTPQLLEVEMTENDADTISYMLKGAQVRDRDNGIITTYNDENEIYQQFDYYTVKNKLGEALYDVKKPRTNIDGDQDYDNVIGD